MKLENQVTSLETSKKLKELGVKQESLFYWVELMRNYKWTGEYELEYGIPGTIPEGRYYSAFTVAELGEELPAGYGSHKVSGLPNRSEDKNIITKWSCTSPYKENDPFFIGVEYETAKSEAEARAKMRIYLIKNKLL